MNIVSFGGGTNSTAMIIGMYLHKIPIEQLTFDQLFPDSPGGCICGAPCGCYDG
jgi:hypothetical protein